MTVPHRIPLHPHFTALRKRRSETSAELDSEESRAVLSGNALKLFPRLAARASVRY